MTSSSTITLPQLTARFPIAHGQEYLVAAGGRAPKNTWLKAAAPSRHLWAVDRGLECILSAGLTPERLIGDGDSASPAAWKHAVASDIPVEKFPVEKDFTDTDLALQKIKAENPSAFITLTGAFGGRFDHAFTTMYSFLGSGLAGCLADDRECMFLLHGPAQLTVELHKHPLAVSLLPMKPEVTGVNISGVHWPLQNTTLQQEKTLSVSNRLADGNSSCTVSLTQGKLGVYFVWDESAL